MPDPLSDARLAEIETMVRRDDDPESRMQIYRDAVDLVDECKRLRAELARMAPLVEAAATWAFHDTLASNSALRAAVRECKRLEAGSG
jgi:hypothetical protein